MPAGRNRAGLLAVSPAAGRAAGGCGGRDEEEQEDWGTRVAGRSSEGAAVGGCSHPFDDAALLWGASGGAQLGRPADESFEAFAEAP